MGAAHEIRRQPTAEDDPGPGVVLRRLGLDLEPGVLEFVVDRSPVKQGKFIPGARVPIWPTADLLTEAPDFTVLFTWNLADEIVEQQAEYRRRGGRFIRPLPEVTVV